MSYKALYRKYRPKCFDDVKGQDYIIQTLKNIIRNRKISHAYLFCGPRGVGKTSVARIFANLINCYHNNDDYSKLCQICEENGSNTIDIIEMDAASNNGVDSIRELRDKIQHLPSAGNYKIYIIDEVHMLSKGAFNALLKTLEEPPAHVIFIFATTDPQKIPLTILSRVQRFNFRRISNDTLVKQIKNILEQEGIKYDAEALPYIARLAVGSMRDALSIIDQANAYGNGYIKFSDVMYSFGITSNDNLIKIINSLYNGKPEEALMLLQDLKNGGIDPKQFVESLLSIFKDFIIYEKTYKDSLFEILTIDQFNTLEFDLHYAVNSSELLYKLAKEMYYASGNLFQLIELYLVKMAREIEHKEEKKEQVIMQVEKQVDKEDKKARIESINEILSQTQEIVLESNNDSSINDILSSDILTNEQGDLESDFSEESPLINTSEIDLTQFDDKDDEPKIKLFPKYDKSFDTGKEFSSKFSVDQLKSALILSDQQQLKSASMTLNYLVNLSDNKEYKELIEVLKNVNIKAAGENYIVLTSDNISALNYLQSISYKQNFQEFIKENFGSYKHMIFYEKSKFKEIALEVVSILRNNNTDEIKKAQAFADVVVEKEHSSNKQLFDLLSSIK
ncbi:DNA polymerase III subunit gamma and TAU [Mycoplasmopsis agalactiae 14628]|uniref:DNA polymerase III subunit gamma/tau n=2 Tax=Bacteria TaxID=2 RepID=I5D6E2_MYCAA|nr:DNA polymerase III subunit gamma/tau [Mycoplasmopsis agalactiae]EIN15251.1 DNA polymerase III subunit gamma and TAU [Mycoplasmopsis agalactiae 14628]